MIQNDEPMGFYIAICYFNTGLKYI